MDFHQTVYPFSYVQFLLQCTLMAARAITIETHLNDSHELLNGILHNHASTVLSFGCSIVLQMWIVRAMNLETCNQLFLLNHSMYFHKTCSVESFHQHHKYCIEHLK